MVKISYVFIFFLYLSSNTGLKAQERGLTKINYIPKELTEFITSISNYIPYEELPDYSLGNPPEFISKIQAYEDVKNLKYILDYGYCGRYYWGQHRVDFNKLYSDLKKFVKNSEGLVPVRGFENIIIKGLANLNDGHSKIMGMKTTEFAKSKKAYFAEIVLEQQGSDYIVVQSKEAAVNAGDKYLDSKKYLFPTLSRLTKTFFY